ncbi:MAG: uL15m family ribosomal protein, partial [Desulfobacterales bacterium]
LSRFESGTVVDEAALIRSGLVKNRRDGIKLLANGEISYPLTVRLNLVSKGARTKIEAVGGTLESEISGEVQE